MATHDEDDDDDDDDDDESFALQLLVALPKGTPFSSNSSQPIHQRRSFSRDAPREGREGQGTVALRPETLSLAKHFFRWNEDSV